MSSWPCTAVLPPQATCPMKGEPGEPREVDTYQTNWKTRWRCFFFIFGGVHPSTHFWQKVFPDVCLIVFLVRFWVVSWKTKTQTSLLTFTSPKPEKIRLPTPVDTVNGEKSGKISHDLGWVFYVSSTGERRISEPSTPSGYQAGVPSQQVNEWIKCCFTDLHCMNFPSTVILGINKSSQQLENVKGSSKIWHKKMWQTQKR